MANFKLWLAVPLLVAATWYVVSAEEDHVIPLGSDSFDNSVSDGNVYFVKFFAPWCGHCKRLVPTWKELANEFKDNNSVKIAHVDCTVHRQVCSKADIKGYPTLKVFHKGEEYKLYKGPRDLDALKKFVQEAADDLTQETTE